MVRKYVEALVASKEDTAKSLATARAAEQRANLGLTREKLKLSIMSAENKLNEMAGEYPLPANEILTLQDDIALDKRRLEQMDKLDQELFG